MPKNVCFAMVSEKTISFFLYVPSGSDSSVRQRTSTASFYLCCSRYVTCICTVGGVHVYTVLHALRLAIAPPTGTERVEMSSRCTCPSVYETFPTESRIWTV